MAGSFTVLRLYYSSSAVIENSLAWSLLQVISKLIASLVIRKEFVHQATQSFLLKNLCFSNLFQTWARNILNYYLMTTILWKLQLYQLFAVVGEQITDQWKSDFWWKQTTSEQPTGCYTSLHGPDTRAYIAASYLFSVLSTTLAIWCIHALLL